MSKFKPGDIVFWMDGNVLCQSVVCVEDGRWPTVPEGYCIVYNISPDYGTRQFSHQADSSRYCDLVQAKDLYSSSDALIESIKDNLRDEYVRKLDDAVKMARANKEWRREYMTLMMRDLENQEMGAARAHKEMIERLLRSGKTPEEIHDFCGYPMKLILEVQNEMLVTQ